jgi:hypothetical protein
MSAVAGCTLEDLVTQEGGSNGNRHTWVHEDVALDLAAWISLDFKAWMINLVKRYVRGQVTTEESRAVAAQVQQAQTAVQPQPLATVTAEQLNQMQQLQQVASVIASNRDAVKETVQVFETFSMEKYGQYVQLFEKEMSVRKAADEQRLGSKASEHALDLKIAKDNADLEVELSAKRQRITYEKAYFTVPELVGELSRMMKTTAREQWRFREVIIN